MLKKARRRKEVFNGFPCLRNYTKFPHLAALICIILQIKNLENQLSAYFKVSSSGVGRDRTGDTRIFSPLLYRLSYRTIRFWECKDSIISETAKKMCAVLPMNIIHISEAVYYMIFLFNHARKRSRCIVLLSGSFTGPSYTSPVRCK
ncbi:MAG: hypothetical protein K0Q79_689 [Flavipsychrobacter sp.]|nr:hypothetical protein [Flavipsychrobacter sp.]